MIVCETPRLTIRHFTPDDLDPLAEMFRDAKVMEFSLGTMTREETMDWIEKNLAYYQAHGHGQWAVVLQETPAVLGFCGVTWKEIDGAQEAEIGYRLRRQFWGRGYATEAAIGCRDVAFERLGLTRVISIIDPANTRSIRVAEKNGMRHERDAVFVGFNVGVYAVHASEV